MRAWLWQFQVPLASEELPVSTRTENPRKRRECYEDAAGGSSCWLDGLCWDAVSSRLICMQHSLLAQGTVGMCFWKGNCNCISSVVIWTMNVWAFFLSGIWKAGYERQTVKCINRTIWWAYIAVGEEGEQSSVGTRWLTPHRATPQLVVV